MYLRPTATRHQLLDPGPKPADRVGAVVVAVHGGQLAVALDLRHQAQLPDVVERIRHGRADLLVLGRVDWEATHHRGVASWHPHWCHLRLIQVERCRESGAPERGKVSMRHRSWRSGREHGLPSAKEVDRAVACRARWSSSSSQDASSS